MPVAAPGGNDADGAAAAAPERYRFARCTRPLPAAVMRKLGVPLPEGERQVVHDDLGWEEIQVGGRCGVVWCVSRRAITESLASPFCYCEAGSPQGGGGMLLRDPPPCLQSCCPSPAPLLPSPPPPCSPAAAVPLLLLPQWDTAAVTMRGSTHPLARIYFMDMEQQQQQ